MKLPPFAKHLLHRRCRWCANDGYRRGHAAGFLEAARASKERERLLRQGIDPDKLEQFIRERAA